MVENSAHNLKVKGSNLTAETLGQCYKISCAKCERQWQWPHLLWLPWECDKNWTNPICVSLPKVSKVTKVTVAVVSVYNAKFWLCKWGLRDILVLVCMFFEKIWGIKSCIDIGKISYTKCLRQWQWPHLLGNVTKIGPTQFVFHRPRYPRKLKSLPLLWVFLMQNFACVNEVLGTYLFWFLCFFKKRWGI